jgi:hypothetical protein
MLGLSECMPKLPLYLEAARWVIKKSFKALKAKTTNTGILLRKTYR